MARRVVDVLVPVALDRAYSYRVPPAIDLAAGDIVTVPLGPRETTGVVWSENAEPNPRLDNRLKDIEEKLEFPPLKPELRRFVDWVANYTLSARGMVLRMCLRMGEGLGAEPLPHAQAHAKHHAAGRQRVIRYPIDQAAQFGLERREFELLFDFFEPIVEPRIGLGIFRPHHAGGFARAERHRDDIACREVNRGRHTVGIGPVQRDWHQHIDNPFSHLVSRFRSSLAILGRFSPI